MCSVKVHLNLHLFFNMAHGPLALVRLLADQAYKFCDARKISGLNALVHSPTDKALTFFVEYFYIAISLKNKNSDFPIAFSPEGPDEREAGSRHRDRHLQEAAGRRRRPVREPEQKCNCVSVSFHASQQKWVFSSRLGQHSVLNIQTLSNYSKWEH